MEAVKTCPPAPLPVPEIDEINRPHWDALIQGELQFQRCQPCGHAWLPGREQCPHCLSMDIGWETGSGKARLISWITYHVAFNPAFKERLPYIVAIVALDEGPRMLTNIVGIGSEAELTIDAPLDLVIEWEGDVAVARFRLATPAGEPS